MTNREYEMNAAFREMEQMLNLYDEQKAGIVIDFLLDSGLQVGYNKYMKKYFIDFGDSPIANDFYDNRANQEDECFTRVTSWIPKRGDRK